MRAFCGRARSFAVRPDGAVTQGTSTTPRRGTLAAYSPAIPCRRAVDSVSTFAREQRFQNEHTRQIAGILSEGQPPRREVLTKGSPSVGGPGIILFEASSSPRAMGPRPERCVRRVPPPWGSRRHTRRGCSTPPPVGVERHAMVHSGPSPRGDPCTDLASEPPLVARSVLPRDRGGEPLRRPRRVLDNSPPAAPSLPRATGPPHPHGPLGSRLRDPPLDRPDGVTGLSG